MRVHEWVIKLYDHHKKSKLTKLSHVTFKSPAVNGAHRLTVQILQTIHKFQTIAQLDDSSARSCQGSQYSSGRLTVPSETLTATSINMGTEG